MRRKLFTITSALSLLLCLATVVLWARSYSRYDGWILGLGHGHNVASGEGIIIMETG